MNNYITTNIRLPEEDYLRLKEEAFRTSKSLSAVIRQKISTNKSPSKPADQIIIQIRDHANQYASSMKKVDIVKTLREMRNQGKW
ncbi:hypothetical protein HYT02_04130 [Candidatus Gottesmanbacteria bacterium]|nr:hypothetical protein [Candidatus Gottesmanbacteria bacterium]